MQTQEASAHHLQRLSILVWRTCPIGAVIMPNDKLRGATDELK